MSFNADQIDWMRHLATIPPADLCYCGWNPIGKCYHCPPAASLEQRLKVQCPQCGNYPYPKGKSTVTHNIKCSTQDWQPDPSLLLQECK